MQVIADPKLIFQADQRHRRLIYTSYWKKRLFNVFYSKVYAFYCWNSL